jgi:hypothetical protein
VTIPFRPTRQRTSLSPQDEARFLAWYRAQAERAGLDPDPDNPLHKYDYRGAFRAGFEPSIHPEDGLYHWPSEFKDDDHPNRFVRGVDTRAQDSEANRQMTIPFRPEPPAQPQAQTQPDPREFLNWLLATGRTAEAQAFEKFLVDNGQEYVLRNVDRQAEYESGRLANRVARENLNDREMAEALTPSYGQQVTGGLASFLKAVPGGEMAQAGARSLVRDQPYAEALQDVRGAVADAPAPVRVMNTMAGAIPSNAVMPGGPAMQGLLYGGSLNALQADPETVDSQYRDFVNPTTMGERAFNAGVGGVTDAMIGKGMDVASTAGRALFNRGIVGETRALTDQRANATRPLFEQADIEGAMAQGARGTQGIATPGIRQVLREPRIAEVQSDLMQLQEFRGLPVDDPRVLDATYKALGDIERQLQAPLNAMNPTRVNTGRFNVRDVQSAKQQLLDAMSRAPNAPMPTYAGAVDEYAAQSGLLDATNRGYQAMRTASGAGGSPKNLLKHGPESLLDFLEGAQPEVGEAALRGAESHIKRSVGAAGITGMLNPLRTVGRSALLDGGNLLRKIESGLPQTTPRTLLELLNRSAVVGGTPTLGTP